RPLSTEVKIAPVASDASIVLSVVQYNARTALVIGRVENRQNRSSLPHVKIPLSSVPMTSVPLLATAKVWNPPLYGAGYCLINWPSSENATTSPLLFCA